MSTEHNDLGFVHRFLPGPGELTLVLLHGTGGDENDLLQLGRALDPSAALLSPRGKVLESGMPRFFRRLAEGVFDLDDLRIRTHELADFVEAAAQVYRRDPRGLVAVGFSNGANIAASVLLLRPRTFAAAALFRPMVPLVPDELPDLSGVPVLVSAGRLDPIVPQAQTTRLADVLQQAGADVSVHWEATGHGLAAGDLTAARSWLERVRTRLSDSLPSP
jgi:predicted esterase